MKAVLIGNAGADKLYFILDADKLEKNGAVVRSDDSVIRVDVVSFASKSRNLIKIRTSKFHRFLWDSPKNPVSGLWYETFIARSKEIDKKYTDGLKISSQIGKPAKKQESVEKRAGKQAKTRDKQKMVKSKGMKMNSGELSLAWTAIKMLHEVGEIK